MMAQGFDEAEERARLAAADLLAAANDVVRRRSVSWGSARDEVDFAELSRIGRYLPSRKLDDAKADLDRVPGVQAEIDAIVAAHASAPSDEAESIRRLTAIADDCERRAISLRL
jgi:hypothetical protein